MYTLSDTMTYTLTTDEAREQLFLKISSPEADEYYNLNCDSIGKEISLVLPPEIATAIYFNFRKVKYKDFSATFAYEKRDAFWRVDFEYSYPEIQITAEKISTKEHVQDFYRRNFLNTIPFTIFQDSYGTTFTASKHEDGKYYVDSASESFLKDYNLVAVGTTLNRKLLVRNDLPSVFDFSLKNNFPMILTDYFTASYGKTFYLALYILPIIHDSESLFVSVNVIDEELFSNLNYNNTPYNNQVVTAQAVFDENMNFVLTQSSEPFSELFPKSKLGVLFGNELMLKAARTRNTTSGFIDIPDSGSYFFYFMPNLYESKIHIIGTERFTIDSALSEITASLTSREAEIFEHLMSGEPFKVISIELGIAEGTVKKLSSNIYKKLNVNSRVDLLRSVFGLQ